MHLSFYNLKHETEHYRTSLGMISTAVRGLKEARVINFEQKYFFSDRKQLIKCCFDILHTRRGLSSNIYNYEIMALINLTTLKCFLYLQKGEINHTALKIIYTLLYLNIFGDFLLSLNKICRKVLKW